MDSGPASDDAKGVRRALVPAALAALLVAGQGIWWAVEHSQTWDEAYALGAGYLQVERGDFELLYENPPLLGLLTYLPLRLAGARLPGLSPEQLRSISPPRYGRAFLYGGGAPHRRLLLWSRCAVLVLTCLAVLVVVLWAGRLHGPAAAWLACILCAAEPSWLAHGVISAWDGICAASMALAAAALGGLLRRPTPGRGALAGLACGMAWSAKHSALLLWPCLLLLAWLASPLAGRFRVRPDPGVPPGRRALLAWGLVPLLGLLVVGASYNLGFRYDVYLHSISGIYRLATGDYQNYLCGEYLLTNFPHYYLVALLVKTPLGFLPLLPLGLARIAGRLRAGADPRRLLALGLPALVLALLVLAASMYNPHNIGVRHVLPAIPLMIVLAAGAAGPARGLRGRALSAAALALALLGAAESAWRAPHRLSFFNLAAGGGPEPGLRILDESNVDWGQDLVALARVLRQERVRQVALLYFGSADPAAYGIRWRPIKQREIYAPRPGQVYAVSLQYLGRLNKEWGPRGDWLRLYRPWRIAGTTLYLYRW
jgi:hypothetical protein